MAYGSPGRRLGRNELCWCGSGRKYKHCHLNRQREEAENPFESMKRLERFNKKRVCLHPDSGAGSCSDKIVRAHTIQRSGSLIKIAEKGHVLGYARDAVSLGRNFGKLSFKPIGINDASTFNGFCSYHDSKTFAPLESVPFEATEEQCFLLGYRAHCRELYQKETVLDAMGLMRQADKGRNDLDQVCWQSKLDGLQSGFTAGYRDLTRRKQKFDDMLCKRDFSDARFYVIRTLQIPELMASFGFTPQYDFGGSRLQDLRDLSIDMDALYVSVIAAGDAGAVVFSWVDEQNGACTGFIESLHSLSDAEVPNAIVRLVFEHSENTFVKPSWWDSLDDVQRSLMLNRASVACRLDEERLPSCLQDDGTKCVNWTVVERVTNLAV